MKKTLHWLLGEERLLKMEHKYFKSLSDENNDKL